MTERLAHHGEIGDEESRDDIRGAHHVVVVGGGFGGLQAALALRRAPVDVTLVDRREQDGDAYADYMRKTSIAEYAGTPGSRGAWMLRRLVDTQVLPLDDRI